MDKFTERAKEEYWLNQDRIPMDIEERVARHACDVQLALVEQLEKFREVLDGWFCHLDESGIRQR